jgi:hypothetical protein
VPLAAGNAAPATLDPSGRFAGYNFGYLDQTILTGRVYGLYTVNGVGGFDAAVAKYDFVNEGTVALGELATLFYGVAPAKSFQGSVFVVTGRNDAIVCNNADPLVGADCLYPIGTNKVAEAGALFPAAKDYSYFIPGQTGHSANLHHSAQDSFKAIHAYLVGQGY